MVKAADYEILHHFLPSSSYYSLFLRHRYSPQHCAQTASMFLLKRAL